MVDIPLSDFRQMAVEEFDTTKLLAHAAQQATRARLRANSRSSTSTRITTNSKSLDRDPRIHGRSGAAAARAERDAERRLEGHRRAAGRRRLSGHRRARACAIRCAGWKRCRGDEHRDITLTRRWMDAMGIDVAVMFPTPMLQLGLHPQVEVEVALARAYNRWLVETRAGARAAHPLDALSAVQRSGRVVPHGAGIRRQARRGRLHGDGGALPAGAPQRLHEDLRAAGGAWTCRSRSTPPTTGTTSRWR